MFADGKVLDVSVQFLRQCTTLSMFGALPDMEGDGCWKPISIPGLEYDQHAYTLGVVSTLDDLVGTTTEDDVSIRRRYDLQLGTLSMKDLFTLLHTADYLQHQRAMDSCARIVAGRLKGKSRGEMLHIMGLEESRERMQLIETSLSWVIVKDDVPDPW